MRTAIIGMGVTGLSCLRHLAGIDELTVLDTRDEPPNAAAARAAHPETRFEFGADALERFDFRGLDRVVVSPGVRLDHPLVRRAAAAGAALCSDIDLFCSAVNASGAAAPIVAITGTNGKSTVTALVGHLLAQLGRAPGVGGNLGEPALDLLDASRPGGERDCYVLELSSFQLERMHAHRFEAATVLNVTEDHLDRHGSLAGYAESKQHIYADAARAVANRHDPLTRPRRDVPELCTFGLDAPVHGMWGVRERDGARLLARGDEPVIAAPELPLTGTHNELNVLAAFALVAGATGRVDDLAQAIAGFRGLPHRCALVAERRGVRFVNDSKATNVGAALAALSGLGDAHRRRLVLIAGGDGKGADFAPLAEPVARYVKSVVLLGRDAPALAAALSGHAPVVCVRDMAEAVDAAARLAEPGDTVLLSPACASLDMFSNFAARGDAFAAAVEALA